MFTLEERASMALWDTEIDGTNKKHNEQSCRKTHPPTPEQKARQAAYYREYLKTHPRKPIPTEKKKEYAVRYREKKKAAQLLEQSSGAQENN